MKSRLVSARVSSHRHPRRWIAACLVAALACAPLSPTRHVPAPIADAVAQTLPDLGDASQASLSPAQESKLGEAVVHQLRASGAYLNDPEVNDYLNEIGHRLIAASTDVKTDFHFFAVNDPTINAFALPGGYVGVNTGLILLTQSESELASVLAHEITHVTQHHIARSIAAQKDSMLMSLAGLAVAILAARGSGASSGDAASGAIAATQALSIQHEINFTRDQEREADRIGFERLDAAGFDVNAMATFMERLQRATRFSGGANVPAYLQDHPVTYERIAEAQARAASVPYRQVVDSLDYDLVRALLRSYEGEPQQAVKYFDDALAEHKYNNKVATQYGLVAALLRTKDQTRMQTELARLEKIAPPHPMIDAIAGHVLLETGQLDAAIRRFKAGVDRYPNKMQMVYDYPDALLKAGRSAEAARFVEHEIDRFPNDGPLQLLAARAYAAQNKQMLSHQHQAEYYAWQGNLKGAIDQLEIASKSGDGNFYEASVVDSRLRAFKKEDADEKKAGFGRSG
ncbi:MAG: M48 family metalloprotease [Casimicrobiaceae bacterium]